MVQELLESSETHWKVKTCWNLIEISFAFVKPCLNHGTSPEAPWDASDISWHPVKTPGVDLKFFKSPDHLQQQRSSIKLPKRLWIPWVPMKCPWNHLELNETFTNTLVIPQNPLIRFATETLPVLLGNYPETLLEYHRIAPKTTRKHLKPYSIPPGVPLKYLWNPLLWGALETHTNLFGRISKPQDLILVL